MKKRNLKSLKLKKNVVSSINSLNTKGGVDTRYYGYSEIRGYNDVIHGWYVANACYV